MRTETEARKPLSARDCRQGGRYIYNSSRPWEAYRFSQAGLNSNELIIYDLPHTQTHTHTEQCHPLLVKAALCACVPVFVYVCVCVCVCASVCYVFCQRLSLLIPTQGPTVGCSIDLHNKVDTLVFPSFTSFSNIWREFGTLSLRLSQNHCSYTDTLLTATICGPYTQGIHVVVGCRGTQTKRCKGV